MKCLLIVPNAESALNEEAGKLLLEHYDDYSQRARMMTEIHAQVVLLSPFSLIVSAILYIQLSFTLQAPKISKGYTELAEDDGPCAKKHAGDKKLLAEKKKILRDKKRVLKRL